MKAPQPRNRPAPSHPGRRAPETWRFTDWASI